VWSAYVDRFREPAALVPLFLAEPLESALAPLARSGERVGISAIPARNLKGIADHLA